MPKPKSVRADRGLMGQISEPPSKYVNVRVIDLDDGTHAVELRVYEIIDGKKSPTEHGFNLAARSIPGLIQLLQRSFHEANVGESRRVSV